MASTLSQLIMMLFFIFFSKESIAQGLNLQDASAPHTFIKGVFLEFGMNPDVIYFEPSENIDDVEAGISNNKRYLIYNPDWIRDIGAIDYTFETWFRMGILTHEIGHHIQRHISDSRGFSPEMELEADWWSGFAMKKLGANLEQALSTVQLMDSASQSRNYPNRRYRIEAVTKGYYNETYEPPIFQSIDPHPASKDDEYYNPPTPDDSNRSSIRTVTLGNQTYPVKQFGDLVWMRKNLNYEVDDSWCYDNAPFNCQKYGRLYTWEAAKKACAAVGWRLPTDQEWRELTNRFGGADIDAADNGKTAFEALVEGGKSGFNAQLGGTLSSSFSGRRRLGRRDKKSAHEFRGLTRWGLYWSSTKYDGGQVWTYIFGISTEDKRNYWNIKDWNITYGVPKEYLPTSPVVPKQPSKLERLRLGISKPYSCRCVMKKTDSIYSRPEPDNSPPVNANSVTYAGETYSIRRFGELNWMTENLNLAVPDSWCYGEDPTYCEEYGRLYTWEAAKKACQSLGDGWRLPTDQEWLELYHEVAAGIDEDALASDPNAAIYQEMIEGGNSGFSAQLGGKRHREGFFQGLGYYGSYWNATVPDTGFARFWSFDSKRGKLVTAHTFTSGGFSCRCVQGAPSNGKD